jgi:ankyrin repeat protein
MNYRDILDNNVENVRIAINPKKINNITCGDYTALMYACKIGNIEIVKLLLDNGANIKIKYKMSWFEFIFAPFIKYKL